MTPTGQANTMQVLIVMPEEARSSGMCGSFQDRGFSPTEARSALYALTMLERDTPQVIVSAPDLSDMTGRNFLDIVRDDPSLGNVLFVLLAEEHESHIEGASNSDLILPQHTRPDRLVEAVREALVIMGALPEEQQRPPTFSLMNPANVFVSGTLEVLSLFDLTMLLSGAKRSGRLHLMIQRTEAIILFYKGQLIDANYNGQTGEPALVRVFDDAKQRDESEFVFESLDPSNFSRHSASIRGSAQELLLRIAVHLDHQYADNIEI